MTTAVRLDRNDTEMINGMKQHIEELKRLSPEQARAEAFETLFRAGVIDADGKTKENIVSWA